VFEPACLAAVPALTGDKS